MLMKQNNPLMFLMLWKKKVYLDQTTSKGSEEDIGILKMLRDMSESHDKFSGHLPYAASIRMLSATSYKEPISKWFQPGPHQTN